MRDLLGVNPKEASPRAYSQAEIIASCQISLVKYPDWLKDSRFGLDLADDSLLEELDKQITAIQGKAILDIQKKAEAARASLAESVKTEK